MKHLLKRQKLLSYYLENNAEKWRRGPLIHTYTRTLIKSKDCFNLVVSYTPLYFDDVFVKLRAAPKSW